MKFLNFLRRKVSSELPTGGDAGSAASDSAYQWEATRQKLTNADKTSRREAVTSAKETIDIRYQQFCEYHGYRPVTTAYGVNVEDLDKEHLVKLVALLVSSAGAARSDKHL